MEVIMRNRIDLSAYPVRTDLMIDYNIGGDIKKINDSISVTTINLDNNLGIKLGKKSGTYVTIEFVDVTNHEDKLDLGRCLTEEIDKFLELLCIDRNDNGLVIGLGNRFSTADSLGPKCIDSILVTRHLFELKTNVKDGMRNVAAFCPGVMANTGIESFDIIMGIIERIRPKFLIMIDALASSSIDRLNKTIQLTDTGIHPGSGIGNNRLELSKDTLGIPVLSIGVPTVVPSSIIVNDAINYLFKHISYLKEHYDSNKLVFLHNDGYINKIKNLNLSDEEKKEVSGMLGVLDEDDKKALINEVLYNINYDMIVTPKEIDFLIDSLSEVIGHSINQSLHPAVER